LLGNLNLKYIQQSPIISVLHVRNNFIKQCMCNFACKGCSQNDLYCVGRDVKPYSLTHSSLLISAPQIQWVSCWHCALYKL